MTQKLSQEQKYLEHGTYASHDYFRSKTWAKYFYQNFVVFKGIENFLFKVKRQ